MFILFVFNLTMLILTISYNKFFNKNITIEFLEINEFNNTILSTLNNLFYKFSFNRALKVIYFYLKRKNVPFSYVTIFWALSSFFLGISYFFCRFSVIPIFETMFIHKTDKALTYLFIINSYLAESYQPGWRIYINKNIKVNGSIENFFKNLVKYNPNFVDCKTKSITGRNIYHPTTKDDEGRGFVVTHGKNLNGFKIVGPDGEDFNMKILPTVINKNCEIKKISVINERLKNSFLIGFYKALFDFKNSEICYIINADNFNKPHIEKMETKNMIKQYNFNELLFKLGINDKSIQDEIKQMYGIDINDQ